MKKMDRRGFTLVEVLAVLVILTIILSIAIPSITASLERSKGKQVTASNDLVLKAAELYVNDYKSNIINNMDNDECYINISELRDGGYITSSNNDLYNIEYVIYNKTNNLISEIPSDKTVDNYSVCNKDEYLIPEGDTGSDGSSVKYLINHVKLGDYVQMTPNTVSEGYSGGSDGMSVTTLNTRELNLWRVIKKSNDGIEMISEHVSSANIKFGGELAYRNYIKKLNDLAGLYENDEFTKGSRYFGYCDKLTSSISSEQVLYTGKIDTDASNWDKNTELSGGGDRRDMCYYLDLTLLEVANVSLFATKPNETTGSSYWFASRHYSYYNTFDGYDKYYGRYIKPVDNDAKTTEIADMLFFGYNYSGDKLASIRPIIILKKDVIYTNLDADGTSNKPYILG